MILQNTHDGETLRLVALAGQAAEAIPPLWPLATSVAVNPFLGQTEERLEMTAARLSRVAGVAVTTPRAELLAQVEAGDITHGDLQEALSLSAVEGVGSVEDLLARAKSEAVLAPDALPTVADLAADASGIDWPAIIAERFGLFAAGHFDEGQALWPAPDRAPFEAWHAFARRDLTPELHGLTGFASRVAEASRNAPTALAQACVTLGLSPEAAETAFHRLLMTMGGWAQYARYKDWTGQAKATVTDLLTIRITWEAALLDLYRDQIGDAWARVVNTHATPLHAASSHQIDAALQTAAELAHQRALGEVLTAPVAAAPEGRSAVQAAFCIDVRSEPFRRAFEAQDPSIDTVGVAGFFGVLTRHFAPGSDVAEDRAPVLVPAGTPSAAKGEDDGDMRIKARALRAWGRFRQAAVSSFAFVEAAGPIYAAKLVKDSTGLKGKAAFVPAPMFGAEVTLDDKVAMAKGLLASMSLPKPLAPLVALVGHGSHVTLNPHESGLNCGACGGHSGEVNARLAASLLNDAEVRAVLGDMVPEDTRFVAALHATTTDKVSFYGADAGLERDAALAQVQAWMDAAGVMARGARVASLPGAETGADVLGRALDWAQTRPEWGLAGCAAFIAAPRARTRGRELDGRAFLHSYDWNEDAGFGVLEAIMTAPVVVASWIGLQYYGSSVAPEAFGGGNKLLHNVTGGIGVVEGNGGILRGGLPWQSVHDGDQLVHTPLRLTVAIEAPREAMQAVLEKHAGVKALFDNGWLHLLALEADGKLSWRWTPQGWKSTTADASVAIAAE